MHVQLATIRNLIANFPQTSSSSHLSLPISVSGRASEILKLLGYFQLLHLVENANGEYFSVVTVYTVVRIPLLLHVSAFTSIIHL